MEENNTTDLYQALGLPKSATADEIKKVQIDFRVIKKSLTYLYKKSNFF
jgi:hypothetical protein